MRVGRRSAGRLKFLGSQQRIHFGAHALPLARDAPVGEGLRHAAPAHVLDKDLLLLGCGVAAFGFDALQGADSFQVVVGFLADAAFPDVVLGGYAVIGGSISGWTGPGGSCNSSSASSLAWLCSRPLRRRFDSTSAYLSRAAKASFSRFPLRRICSTADGFCSRLWFTSCRTWGCIRLHYRLVFRCWRNPRYG